MKRSFPIFFLILSCFAACPALAAVFNPVTADDLQTALNTAAASAEDDTINLQANTTYNINDNTILGGPTFTYLSNTTGSLSIVGAGQGSSIIDGNGADQAMSLITSDTNAGIQIQDLTIQNGTMGVGTGLYLESVDGAILIQNCDLTNNASTGSFGGLVVDTQAGNVTINSSNFTGNHAVSSFAGVDVTSDSGAIVLDSNTIINNDAQLSFAGLTLDTNNPNGSIRMTNNTVNQNDAVGSFAGMNATADNDDCTLIDNTVNNNTAGGSFSGMIVTALTINGTGNTVDGNQGTQAASSFVGADVIFTDSIIFNDNIVTNNVGSGSFTGLISAAGTPTAPITFNNNTVSGNDAGGNFAGFNVAGNAQTNINNNTIADHDGTSFVGLILGIGDGDAVIANNIVNGNIAQDSFGGGDISVDAGVLDLVNNTVTGNASNGATPESGGLFVVAFDDNAELNIYNNIFFANSAPTGVAQDVFLDLTSAPNASLQVFNNDFGQLCLDDGTLDCNFAVGVNGNINADPLFVNAAAANFQLGTGSPAIDTGDVNAPNLPATDHDGNPRIVGGGVDMGALEAQPDIGVDPLALDFGTLPVGQSDTLFVTISNQGAVPLEINGLDLSDEVNYSVNTNTGPNPCGGFGFTLDVGESCTVGVVFSPTANGDFDATLTVSSDDPDEADVTVTITGIGQLFDLNGGGCGCSLESAAQPMNYLALSLIPMLIGIVRFRMKR